MSPSCLETWRINSRAAGMNILQLYLLFKWKKCTKTLINTKLSNMNCISFLFCFAFFVASCRISIARVTARRDGVYIVYMGAAATSRNPPRDDIHQIMSSLNRKNQVYHRYTNGFLGFAADLSKEEAEGIAQRPGVVSVFPDQVLKLHTTRSWDFLKHQSGLEMSSSPSSDVNSTSLGEDTIIGFLDTGIWPESKSFSDDGLGPIPSKWKGTCIESPDFTRANCNRKLIGARYYNIINSSPTSNSTRDHVGHGTHVAATAAGSPVSAATYHGLANGTARGGAPRSRIAMYRVCSAGGCLGSSILKAFDDAISDGVDIVSISIGASAENAPDLAEDPIAIGAFHAVERGILVVSSAGNDGPSGQTVVNTAPWILTVAATTIDRHFESDVVLAGNRVIKGGGINYGNIQKNPVYPLIHGLSAKNSNASKEGGRMCAPGALEDSKVKGSILVCEDFGAGFSPSAKLNKIVDIQGGIGVISVDDNGVDVASIYGSYPVATVTSHDVGPIFTYMNTTKNPVATILPTLATAKFKPAPSVPYFSGRGPAFSMQNILKPDIGAPGVDILAAWPSKDKNPSFNILSGTSMSCPHVAGIAATVKSKYPKWGPSAIKSAIMTTAMQKNSQNSSIKTNSGQPATGYDIGAGEVSLTGPLQPGLVYETETSDYLNFLCSIYSHNVGLIKHISPDLPDNFSCPSINSTGNLISNMNYPSISVSDIEANETKKVSRTVTNVGEEDDLVYTLVTHAPKGLQIEVSPSKLHFTKEIKKLSYEAAIRLTRPLKGGEIFGSIAWINGKYKVRSPVVASIRKQ